MPWLAATAFLHSVMIQEKRGMLKVWNMLLVVLAFCLALFGTFLTRSGVINSIHSFTQSPLGAWFLGFICVVTAGSLALVFSRLPLLRAKTRLESLVSREATFLYNNLLLLALGAGSSWIGLVAYTFAAFVLGSIGYEFVRGTKARRALTGGPWFAAFAELIARNRRRYGGYVVHAAIVMLAIGVTGSSAYDTVRTQKLKPGQTMAIRDYTLKYRGLVRRDGPNATEYRALVDVDKNGSFVGTLASGKNSYRAEQQVSNEVAIRSDYLTGEDLYVITDQINRDGSVDFKVLVKPLVNLIWLSGVIFLLGSLIALWPSAAEQRRLTARYRELRAPARA